MRALAILLALSACSAGADPDALSRQLAMMEKAGASSDAICGKAREVAAAWLANEDEREYRMANLEAGLACNRAALDRL